MITRKKKLIRRKSRYSDLLLSDKELRLIQFLEKSTWLDEPYILIAKKKLLDLDLFWDCTLQSLAHKGRVKNVVIHKTNVTIEVVPEFLYKKVVRDLPDPEAI